MSATRHTVVISDLHLTEAVEGVAGDGAWMRYRQRAYFPDREFRRLVDDLLGRIGRHDELDLVFGGDIIDFEQPRTIDDPENPARTEEASIATLERVLVDHEVFFRAIADVVRAGHRVVFVVGNHDVQLSFPRVQERLRAHLEAMVPELAPEEAARRIRVRTWFFQTADGVHVEHGHQYDAYCAFRDPLRPLSPEGPEIHPTVGSVAFRHLVARMGYFNAYDERSYMLSGPGYFAHWARHYLFSRRSLATAWFLGALRVAVKVLSCRPAFHVATALRTQAVATRAAFADQNAMNREALERHAALFAAPADDTPTRVVRELRLDRAIVGAIALGGLMLSRVRPRLGLTLAASAIAAGVAHALLQPHESADAESRRVERVAKLVARIYRARAVVFGHTHIPRCDREDGALLCNTGAWTPEVPCDADQAPPKRRGRPVVWLRRALMDPTTPIEGGLYRLDEDGLSPQIVAESRDRASLVDALRPTIV